MLPLMRLLLVCWQRYFLGIVGCIAVKVDGLERVLNRPDYD